MNTSLIDALQQLNLEPGIYHCELPEHEVVVQVLPRKTREEIPNSARQPKQEVAEALMIDQSCIMLDPWIELPKPKPIGRVVGRLVPPPPPDIPEIPAEDEMS